MPAALALSNVAERTLKRRLGSADKARRLVLSLFFRAALGIERIFHFETLDDLGFALLSGGKKVMLISDNYFCRLATTTSAGGSAVRTACATVRS